MSRSQPSNRVPNPCSRWFEWNGEKGNLRYYDRDEQKSVTVALPFTFLLLDGEMKTVRGFDQKGNCRIYANEVRDTTTDPFVVKSFNSGTIAEGKYRNIQRDIDAAGGHFTASLYIAFKKDGSAEYVLGNVGLKTSALAAWVDFSKKNASDLYEKAISITSFTEGQNGRIVYRMPVFTLVEVSTAAQNAALGLDNELQTYLAAYLKRTTSDRVEAQADVAPADVTADQIPF